MAMDNRVQYGIYPNICPHTEETKPKRATEYSGLSQIDEFPHVKEWMYKLLARPGFERGRNVPNPHIYLQLNELPDEELKKIGRERSGWIQEAMKRDAE